MKRAACVIEERGCHNSIREEVTVTLTTGLGWRLVLGHRECGALELSIALRLTSAARILITVMYVRTSSRAYTSSCYNQTPSSNPLHQVMSEWYLMTSQCGKLFAARLEYLRDQADDICAVYLVVAYIYMHPTTSDWFIPCFRMPCRKDMF
jgi:hypothetical protein